VKYIYMNHIIQLVYKTIKIMIKPIILNGSEIWGSIQVVAQNTEKVIHLRKYLIKLSKT